MDVFGRRVSLSVAAAEAFSAMHAAAVEDDLHLLLISGFRSIERQAEILTRKMERGLPLEEALKFTAYPGHSEHHTGRAVDLGSPACKHLSREFEATEEFAWLNRHAHRFDFALSYPRGNVQGIGYEPWHWCLSLPVPTEIS